MVSKIFGIFDMKADMFTGIFTFNTRGQATRAFSDLACDVQSTIHKHPEDYKLVQLGEFDDNTGDVVAVPHESLGFASEYVPHDL